MKKFRFEGPVQSAVTFGRGKNARDIQLIPGRVVELDADHPWVKSSVAKRHLVPVEDSATSEVKRETETVQPLAGANVNTLAQADGKPAGASEAPKGSESPADNDAPKGVSSALATTGRGNNAKKKD